MLYEDLHRRYGSYVSQRLRSELTPAEFKEIEIESLPDWLEAKAEIAHENYRQLLSNPLATPEKDINATGEACRRWRRIEDLSYTIAIAEGPTVHVLAG